jgi:biotin carboxyl carrier protein
VQRNLRITVEGKAYLVKVEYLDDSGSVMPLAQALAPLAETAPAPAPAKATPAPAPAAPAPAPPAPSPTVTHDLAHPPAPAAETGTAVESQVSGLVMAVEVVVGDVVEAGQQLMVLEAMKMNTYVRAPHAGRVVAILAQKGVSVLAGDTLLRIA